MFAATPTIDAKRTCMMVLRLACVLSLWHAPIPWVHVHTAHSVELANHIEHFHPDLATHLTDESVGWHWHAILPPWGRGPMSNSDDDEPSPLTVIEFEPAVAGVAIAWHVNVDHAVWNAVHQPILSAPWHHNAVGSPDEFLGTYLLNRSAQQFLSVCLC